VSYCLTAYRVDLLKLLDSRLADRLWPQVEAFVRDTSPIVRVPPELPLDVPPPEPTMGVQEAVRRVLLGGVWGPEHQGEVQRVMLLFYQQVCSQQLQELAMRHTDERIAAADVVLRARGVAESARLRNLFFGGLPREMSIAVSEESRVGHVPADLVIETRQQIADENWETQPLQLRQLLEAYRRSLDAAAKHRMGLLGEIHSLQPSRGRDVARVYRTPFERVAVSQGTNTDVLLARLDYFCNNNSNTFNPRIDTSDDKFLAWYRENKHRGAANSDIVGAARDLVEGRTSPKRYAKTYEAAVQALCHVAGTMLRNDAVAPTSPGHLSAVDQALAAQGLGDVISVCRLALGGLPFALPVVSDEQSIGHMTAESVRTARGAIGQHDWTAHGLEVQQTIALLDEWIEQASANSEGIVAFYA
jgi:hypothetical protein